MFTSSNIDSLLSTLVYLSATFVLLVIGKWVYKFCRPSIKIKHELVEADNLAFSTSYVGYFIGLLLVIGGAIIGPASHHGILHDLEMMAIFGGMGIVLLNISILVNDKLLLRHFNVKKEIIDDQNVGTGVVEAANAISTGLILMGALVGEGGDIITALACWGIGQLVLLLVARVYNAMLSYNVHKHIEQDNVAVGIGLAGALIAVANLVRAGITGDFEGWEDLLISLALVTAIGLVILPVLRFAADKLLLPGRKITDELINQTKPNCGAALIEAFSYIGGSILLSWCL